MIVAAYNLQDLPNMVKPMAHHKAGLSYTRSGYGSRMPSTNMVQLPGSPRWRRVYVCCWSNAGTAYVPDRDGNWIVIL